MKGLNSGDILLRTKWLKCRQLLHTDNYVITFLYTQTTQLFCIELYYIYIICLPCSPAADKARCSHHGVLRGGITLPHVGPGAVPVRLAGKTVPACPLPCRSVDACRQFGDLPVTSLHVDLHLTCFFFFFTSV